MPKEPGKIRSEYLFAALMCIVVALCLTVVIVTNSCSADDQSGQNDSESGTSSDAVLSGQTESTGSDADVSGGTQSDAVSAPSLPADVENVTLNSPAKATEGLLVPLPTSSSASAGGQLQNIYSWNASKYANEGEHPYTYSGTKLELREDALTAFNAMTTAFRETQGKTNLLVNRAYLASPGADAKAAEKNLASGCAVELGLYPADPDGDSIGSGKFLWLADNCTNYGYILRYPAEKSAATHESGNAGLYRYVGFEHAAYMGANHLCLEEYLEAVRTYSSASPLRVSYKDVNGLDKTCAVYFVPATGGEATQLPILSGEQVTGYTYSGNGSDGFVVTCYLS